VTPELRPHQALKGKTPPDLAGIKVKGDNKWLTLIQNASLEPTFKEKDNNHRGDSIGGGA
jgi:hypothetical protein